MSWIRSADELDKTTFDCFLLGLTGAFVLDDPEDADIRNNVDEEVLAFIEGMVGAEIASYIRKQRDDYRKGGSALSPSGT